MRSFPKVIRTPRERGFFGSVGGRFGRIGPIRIGLACAGKSVLNYCTIGGDDFGANALDGEHVAGFGDDVIVFCRVEQGLVGVVKLLRSGFAIFAVIDESAYRDALSELRSAADVVVVVVSDEDVVTPAGQSLLIDTGWPDNNFRDADCIVAAAKDAGIAKLERIGRCVRRACDPDQKTHRCAQQSVVPSRIG
jgi:hypothetical protein